jgi:hypothetical protein
MRYGITPSAYWPLNYWPYGEASLATPQAIGPLVFALTPHPVIQFDVDDALVFGGGV